MEPLPLESPEDGSRTRYEISRRTFRIIYLNYEERPDPNAEPVKYRIYFKDFRVIQNSLIPYSTMVFQNGKLIEERTVVGQEQGDSQDLLRLKWLECIRTRAPSPSPVDLGARVMVIVDLAARSMWEGGAFGFDPATLEVRKL